MSCWFQANNTIYRFFNKMMRFHLPFFGSIPMNLIPFLISLPSIAAVQLKSQPFNQTPSPSHNYSHFALDLQCCKAAQWLWAVESFYFFSDISFVRLWFCCMWLISFSSHQILIPFSYSQNEHGKTIWLRWGGTLSSSTFGSSQWAAKSHDFTAMHWPKFAAAMYYVCTGGIL